MNYIKNFNHYYEEIEIRIILETLNPMRKKEIFKTSGGKYIVPQVMENKFKESRFIEQIMVVGENQKFPGALIVPNFSYLREWAITEKLNVNCIYNAV